MANLIHGGIVGSTGKLLLIASILCIVSSVSAFNWAKVDAVLANGIKSRTTPGLQALVADSTGIIYHKTFGNYTYGIAPPFDRTNPPVTFNSIFDMASLTKVLATTTTAMLLYDRGLLDLDMHVADPTLLGPSFAQNGKGQITIRNLLLHDSGFPPDPIPGYGDSRFGCPESSSYYPRLTFSCVPKIYQSLMVQKLQNPVGAVYVYSDLSMIAAEFVFGKIIKENGLVLPSQLLPECSKFLSNEPEYHCYFEAFLRIHVIKTLGMSSSGFLLDQSKYNLALPTWNDTTYRHILMQGVVSDENAYAAGGYMGHAGLWSTTSDTYLLAKALMFADGTFVKQSTVDMFTKVSNLTQSSRALGWDTNDYKMNTYRGCATLSPRTYTHLGYTGTEVCNDPDRKLITILLTNRVYPNKTDTSQLIHDLRQNWNTAVQEAYDQGKALGTTSKPEIKEMAFFINK